MIFRHLTTENCPHCGAEAFQEGADVAWRGEVGEIATHVNRQRWEWRQFLCGYRVMWSPNFEREEAARGYPCSQSPEEKAKYAKREQASQRIQEFVDALDVDDGFKRDVLFPGRGTVR